MNAHIGVTVLYMSPENAKGQTDRIWDAVKSLEQLPESHQDSLVGRFAGKGYLSNITVY